jgi:hypothetical protein
MATTVPANAIAARPRRFDGRLVRQLGFGAEPAMAEVLRVVWF